ncbi:hypothetical protein JAAARDRAFT_276298 [Jaapia argillacea MUCL 33604]|uniref:Xylanolytic transcriptional activator regulatory domain-containing protein n=1 Tax=Jaapia argillacea MUCL 33604 TaxID=933084 RepID=A0A067Q2U3_9AGAM|nr:hypothetical protein JAAARDRAFT_276298 [Jaapia argillacea MUCL 33604]
MPANNSRHTSSQRFAAGGPNGDDDLVLRRARGEISCAECYRYANRLAIHDHFNYLVASDRLKVRCDKKIPCGSCARRGCPNICPNGSLSTGQGSRYILADTEKLHIKIAEMGNRIRQLEDALAAAHGRNSPERHPLLDEKLLSVKVWPEVPSSKRKGQPHETAVAEAIDALGTLTIGDRGEAKYFGRSGGGETLLFVDGEWEDSLQEVPAVPEELSKICTTFLFSSPSMAAPGVSSLLQNYLPPEPRAWSLCETFFEHTSWFFEPMKRRDLVDEIMTPTYKWLKETRLSDGQVKPDVKTTPLTSPHKLAVLYMVFALGALTDLTLPPFNPEAEKYHYLARMALSLRSFTDSPVIETVLAIALMGVYHSIAGQGYTTDSAWALVSFSAKLAQSIGLHRECTRWGLDERTVQKRRTAFWAIFACDVILSVELGRPPSTPLKFVDCEFPTDEEQMVDEKGDVQPGYKAWAYRKSKELFAPAIDKTLAAEPLKYETILELDRQFQDMSVPQSVKIFVGPEGIDYYTPSVCMRAYLVSQFRLVPLLVIHRNFFAQVLLDYPDNPLASPYAPSYLAVTRTASVVIKSHVHYFERCPELCTRVRFFFTHLFSSSVIMGFILARTPKSHSASEVFADFNLAMGLFEKAATRSVRARRALSYLRKLRDKSQYTDGNRNDNPGTSTPSSSTTGQTSTAEDELALFGGQTRVLSSKNKMMPKDWSDRQNSPASSPPSTTAESQVSSPQSTSSGESTKQTAETTLPSYMEPPPRSRAPKQQLYGRAPPSSSRPKFTAKPSIPAEPVPMSWTGNILSGSTGASAPVPASVIPPASFPGIFPESFSQNPSAHAGFPNGGGGAAEFSLNGFDFDLGSGWGQDMDAASSSTGNLFEFVMNGGPTTEDTGLTDGWMSLMRQSGILDGAGYGFGDSSAQSMMS